mmetsp:Transcript_37401/g.61996  ORF Transcript_37401/g.61996 Transcript_37401/m.61996 type:complete len:311 (-) Transcript_37401:252-1184(-)
MALKLSFAIAQWQSFLKIGVQLPKAKTSVSFCTYVSYPTRSSRWTAPSRSQSRRSFSYAPARANAPKPFFAGSSFFRLNDMPRPLPFDLSVGVKMSSSVASEPGAARASHILVSSKEAAEALLDKIKAGGDFKELAKENSQCPSKEQGGDLGWFKKGMMVPEFEKAAFDTSSLNIPMIVETQFGHHILLVTGQKAGVLIMTPSELADLLKDPVKVSSVQLLDVREPDELQRASIPGFTNMPLSEASKWAPKVEMGDMLDPSKPTIVMCHRGMRSMQVATFLDQVGFETVYNVDGGIGRYAQDVDPSVGTY